jgi:hypothetical protein
MTTSGVTYRQLLETNNALQVLSDEIEWLCVTRTTQESKLFPLAYMLLSFFNAYYRYPSLLRKVETRMSAEECGDRARNMGAKTTLLNMGWCMPGYYINGRELLINMGLVRPEDAVDDLVYIIDFWRRFQLAYHRNDGHLMTREFGHRSQIQPERQLQVFEADALPVSAGDSLHSAAIKFMATVSQYSFLSHCECRMGICNEGPYKLGDNGEMLVRDFVDLANCDFPWLDGVADGIPYNNLTLPLIVQDTHFYLIDDWGSFESRPEFRAENVVGIGLYTSDPLTDGYIPVSMGSAVELVRTLTELQATFAATTAKLWERFAKWSRSQMIEAGALVYYNAPALLAHIAGVYEQSDWMEIDPRARRLVPLLNDEYGRDCLTEMLGLISLPSQQSHEYVMSMHSNRPRRIYSPIPYAILSTGDYTKTSGPVFPGSSILGAKTGKWRTSGGLLDQPQYNQSARAFTPLACNEVNRFLDDSWLNYHHTDPLAQNLYRQAQGKSRRLSGRGASVTRADLADGVGRN